MTWGPKHGQAVSDAEFLTKIAVESGKTPSAIKRQPMLTKIEEEFWNAYNVLQASRPSNGFGPGAIPLSEMATYMDLVQMPRGDRETFVQIMRAMDRAFLAFMVKKHG